MKHIAVFCGSSNGSKPIFTSAAYNLGEEIAKRSYSVIYGGAHVGLMGSLADGALDNGGEVVGVLPRFLKTKELEHKSLTSLYIVDTMHERKSMMNDLSDAVIALPGGWGTMEELFEMLTWGQLALHKKPIGILNLDGFYNSLIGLTETMITNSFLKEEYRNMLIVDTDIKHLLDKMEQYNAPENDKWVETK